MYDALVLGAGPAGCAAATVLARNGHSVALARPASPPAGALAESVPPSARRILEELGLLAAVEDACFHANRGNVVWWAGSTARQETFADGAAGVNVDRAGLERVLVGCAARAGVQLLDETSARRVEEASIGWVVHCDTRAGEIALAARWLVDATGRRGVLATREGREVDRSTSTIALVRRWRRPGGWGGEHAHRTLVESYADGWAWALPLSDEVRCVAAMIDGSTERVSEPTTAAMLEQELDKTKHLGPMLEGAEPDGDAWACSASLYTSSRFARPGLVLAGDAASFIDPLSSFGVKKALSSGWLAGIVANTALATPALTGVATAFFDRRECQVYRRYRSLSAAFFEEAASVYRTAYWERRAQAAREAGDAGVGASGEAPDPDDWAGGVPEREVREAFERIKARPRLDAHVGSTLRRVERPAVEGDRIVLQEHLASDACPDGVRHVRGVDLIRLVASAPGHAEVPDAWAAYNGVAPPVTLPDYLTALSTAFAAGLLGER
jgi:flavin-dependent dehydrogenase